MTFRQVRDLLSDDQAAALDKAPLIGGRMRHPTWSAMFDTKSALSQQTNKSVLLVANAGGTAWLQAFAPRLTRIDDPEEAAAALAELRAFGALLAANFDVQPIPTGRYATPDFRVDAGDGAVVVEVFTKHQHDDQVRLLEEIDSGRTPPGVERSSIRTETATIHMVLAAMQPGGAPNPNKPNDSAQANLISRVCAAKGDETQLPTDTPSLLWIDFGSFGLWPDVVDPEQACPLISGRDGLTSGALWYAFYGWRGAPIFEEDFFPRERIVRMGHDGRFRLMGSRKSKLSGAILALSSGIILLENPWAPHPLSDRARRLCERLPKFDLGRSVCNWCAGDALTLVEVGHRQIEAMENWWKVLNSE